MRWSKSLTFRDRSASLPKRPGNSRKTKSCEFSTLGMDDSMLKLYKLYDQNTWTLLSEGFSLGREIQSSIRGLNCQSPATTDCLNTMFIRRFHFVICVPILFLVLAASEDSMRSFSQRNQRWAGKKRTGHFMNFLWSSHFLHHLMTLTAELILLEGSRHSQSTRTFQEVINN
jgi:hypothetical protein